MTKAVEKDLEVIARKRTKIKGRGGDAPPPAGAGARHGNAPADDRGLLSAIKREELRIYGGGGCGAAQHLLRRRVRHRSIGLGGDLDPYTTERGVTDTGNGNGTVNFACQRYFCRGRRRWRSVAYRRSNEPRPAPDHLNIKRSRGAGFVQIKTSLSTVIMSAYKARRRGLQFAKKSGVTTLHFVSTRVPEERDGDIRLMAGEKETAAR
ncbi:hypothetical protein EVAR_77193_1 [Eumeta japonica]|uniref:Uncharacterized protein n=1 Tax=Eumeta variegata TaxID=151549 RepID=A0A4C1T2Z6_EUMVA|nr:hypothetical protein EVAR_77193_1 [Eumeta japonica]